MLQMDVKRIVAFSTIYQIAVSMFVCFAVDLYLGHLMFCYHMFYKATLFMVLGILVHTFFSVQDLRLMTFSYSFVILV
jgi:NADH:ubiquinone oxidoreductase subunit 5 (subunit L)/multisubunit Na+/H+ antiporter MnhA subunit